MLTILQISDLHRSPAQPVSNDLLLETMLTDIEKHRDQDPKIQSCDVIVVAGDLISGVGIDDVDSRDRLKTQYRQAKDFLTSLCNELLGGDLRRIFIIPGNHDVCWRASRAAMERIEGIKGSEVRNLLTAPNSPYRWSWSDLSLYRIKTTEEYAQRLGDFKDFFDDFYRSVGFTFDLRHNSQTVNFVTPDARSLFSGFCSLAANDCFNLKGEISIDGVAANNLEVRGSFIKDIPLKVAFWHHGIEGSGYNEDHLNSSEILPQLVNHGYALGLHGHQHRSAVVSYAYSMTPQLVMPVVASGSLCAGSHDLPTGYRRQYNIVEIDDLKSKARIHVREWIDNEIWIGPKLQDFGGKSYFDVELPILSIALHEKVAFPVSVSQSIEQAEAAVKARRYTKAISLLKDVPHSIPLVRKLLLEAFHEEGLWNELTDLIGNPENSEELALVVDALSKLGQFDKARLILESSDEPDEYDPTLVNTLRRRLDALEKGAKWRKQ